MSCALSGGGKHLSSGGIVLKKYITLLCLFLTACNTKNTADVSGIKTVSFTPYVINTEVQREKALGEEAKCMSGVCIDGEYAFKNINDFETKTNVSNDVYIRKIEKAEDFSINFIIEVCSKGKSPMFIIKNISDIENIKEMAKKCGSIGVPVFVALDYGSSTELYNQSAEIFRKNAPKAILMWNIPYDYNMAAAPKNELMDWIAINYYEKADDKGIVSNISLLRQSIKYFSNRPVAVNVSVECFSGDNHKYYNAEWGNEVKSVYSLAKDYENIALVSYCENSENNRAYGSSRLSDSSAVQSAYTEAVAVLPKERKWTSTDRVAYVVNDTAYIDIDSARQLNIRGTYANTKYIATKNYSVDNSDRKMFVY